MLIIIGVTYNLCCITCEMLGKGMKGLACAFTGHRPSKFSFGFDEKHPDCHKIKSLLTIQTDALIGKGVTEFFSGMAQGVDLWAAEIVLGFKRNNPELKLFCVLPCETQADKWSIQARKKYFNILAQADKTIYISQQYTDTCMMERNRFMVDHAHFVIAVYNGEQRGGTAATVRYAQKKNKTLILINPNSET